MQKRISGFTIVELLIVIVVIAILAAISIVAYNGIQNRTNDTAIQNDLSAFGKVMEIYRVDNGVYPSLLTSVTGIKLSKNAYGSGDPSGGGRTGQYCRNSSTDSYVLLANSKSGKSFKVQNGVVSSTASTYGWGVCSMVGLSETNPVAENNAYDQSRTPQWAAWTN